jgi:hypothetical protein
VLFPLPLTPFEYYYWSDDRREYPTAFPIDLSFSGKLDQAAFLTALAQARARHPLLSALVDGSTPRPQWISSGQQTLFVDWAPQGVPITHPDGEYIDLRTHVGLRIWVRTAENTTRVLFEFHHACCDGVGSLQFIEELLVCYAGAAGGAGEPPKLSELVVERLRDRGALDAGSSDKPSLTIAVRDTLITAVVWAEIVFQRSALLAVPSPNAAARELDLSRPFLEFETQAISSEVTQQLRGIAASRGTTLNDLLLRDLFIVLRDWNQLHAEASRGRLRVSVPINVRGPDERTMPAANRIGFAFVSPKRREFGNEVKLLDAVHRQMERIKQWKLALFFLGGLAFASNFKRLVPWMLGRNRSFATMVLSNIGRVFSQSALPRQEGRLVCGNVILDGITCVPPIRPLTRAAIAVSEYAGNTIICLRCDPHLFRRDESRALLDSYINRLQATARAGLKGVPPRRRQP